MCDILLPTKEYYYCRRPFFSLVLVDGTNQTRKVPYAAVYRKRRLSVNPLLEWSKEFRLSHIESRKMKKAAPTMHNPA